MTDRHCGYGLLEVKQMSNYAAPPSHYAAPPAHYAAPPAERD